MHLYIYWDGKKATVIIENPGETSYTLWSRREAEHSGSGLYKPIQFSRKDNYLRATVEIKPRGDGYCQEFLVLNAHKGPYRDMGPFEGTIDLEFYLGANGYFFEIYKGIFDGNYTYIWGTAPQ